MRNLNALELFHVEVMIGLWVSRLETVLRMVFVVFGSGMTQASSLEAMRKVVISEGIFFSKVLQGSC